MKPLQKGKKKSRMLREDLELQQKALKKIINALEERDTAGEMKENQTSKSDKNEKT